MTYVPRLKEKYAKDVVPALKKQFEYKSSMQAVSDKKLIDSALNDLATITGQKAVATKSKKDISNFKLRKGVPIGIKVTLRGDKMYEFLDRLISVALPRIRDFRGINEKSFDGKGNYTMGVTEQIIFPEIQIDKVNKIMGMDITFVTSSPTDAEAFALLKQFGLPFKNQKN
jgi:large subunit ribosomal protein L5